MGRVGRIRPMEEIKPNQTKSNLRRGEWNCREKAQKAHKWLWLCVLCAQQAWQTGRRQESELAWAGRTGSESVRLAVEFFIRETNLKRRGSGREEGVAGWFGCSYVTGGQKRV